MNYYLKSKDEVFELLETGADGLSSSEAESRLLLNGNNKLVEGEKTSLLKRFAKQLADPMIIVLLAAAVLSAITAIYEHESPTDVIIILVVVLINSILGVVQETKAEEAIEALKSMTASTTKVLRDGKLIIIKSEDLVPGDIIHLDAGDAVPADARIIECASMKTEEAALTGESVPVEKTADTLTPKNGDISLGDRRNMVYMGSTVVYGRGVAVVTATGMSTEMGKIADALTKAKDEATPLQMKLAGLSKLLTWGVLIISAIIFVIGMLRAGTINIDSILGTFMLAVSLAVAAIPEGLVAVVTIVLSIGVTKMARRNAIIRRLTAVETLGSAQVICSDKTGTLTQNKMTVVDTYGDEQEMLAAAMALCTDAEYDNETGFSTGEPTQCALVNYAAKVGLNKNVLKKEFPRVGEIPFDSMRKMMSTFHPTDEGSYVQYTTGAPDVIFSRCTHVLTESGVVPMTDKMLNDIRLANKSMADSALRVIAAAYREYDSLPERYDSEELENNMIFIGLYGMIDPIRPEVNAAVNLCHDAGIRVIMITGDHIDTAIAIARELGILTDPSQAILGQALDSLSDEELDAAIDKYSVYARVQPEHKVRIVESWRRRGMITAMTGDGVNDAPSIKSADIGIGMGITGTDVTKNVADMILADDNFATIVAAVEEGRKIYSNIRKAIQFLLSSNLSEVISIFIATMLGFTLLKPVHILWINLITDSLPALSFGMEPGEPDAMKKPPRDPKAGIFSGGADVDTIYQGVLIAFLTLIAYLVGHRIEAGVWEFTNSADGTTMAFLTMSMAEIFHSFNMRSRRDTIFKLKEQNIWLWVAAGLAFILTGVVIYVPFMSEAFGFTSISLTEYVIAMSLAITVIPIVELVKLFQRRRSSVINLV